MDYEPDDDEVDVGSFDDDVVDVPVPAVKKFVPALTKYELAAMRAQLLHWIKNNGVQYIGSAGSGSAAGLSPEDVVEKVIADSKLPFRIVRGNGMEVDPNKVN